VATIFVRTMRGAEEGAEAGAGAGMVRVLLEEGGRRGGMRTRRTGECILKVGKRCQDSFSNLTLFLLVLVVGKRVLTPFSYEK
jgi:hypothetical protein